jgi:hypothetical protein
MVIEATPLPLMARSLGMKAITVDGLSGSEFVGTEMSWVAGVASVMIRGELSLRGFFQGFPPNAPKSILPGFTGAEQRRVAAELRKQAAQLRAQILREAPRLRAVLERRMVTDPSASLGFLQLQRGATTYEVMVVTSSPYQARTFLDSFWPE